MFVSVLYAESVQSTLRRRATQMRTLWDQVKEIALDGVSQASGERVVPQVKHIVKLMLALRGKAIYENSNVLTVLEVSWGCMRKCYLHVCVRPTLRY